MQVTTVLINGTISIVIPKPSAHEVTFKEKPPSVKIIYAEAFAHIRYLIDRSSNANKMTKFAKQIRKGC